MKKSFLIVLLLAVLTLIIPFNVLAATDESLVVVGDSGNPYYPNTTVKVMQGDILVTNNTSSAGLTGHTGIVSDSAGNIVHISGPGAHPTKISLSSWFAKNPNTKVVRHSDSAIAYKAASWANSYVSQYYYADYFISTDLLDKDPTYCSKLVWQAYYYGANARVVWVYHPGIVYPYDYINGLTNNIRTILTKGSW